MSEGIIVRRGGGGSSGGGFPELGITLEVVTGRYATSVSVVGDGLSLSVPSSDSKKFLTMDRTTEWNVPAGCVGGTEHGRVYAFHIPKDWITNESQKTIASEKERYTATVTVHDVVDNSQMISFRYYSNAGAWPDGTVITYVLPLFCDFFGEYWHLNPACTITNTNNYLLEVAYNSSTGECILKGSSSGSVSADITTGTSGGIAYSIPGDKYTRLYVTGSASGTTGKVQLYDNNDIKQAEISLTGISGSSSVEIPSGTGPLRLHIVGKSLEISSLYFA